MINIEIPGREPLAVSHIILDYNGTIAEDGELLEKVKEPLLKLKERAELHVLTADTYGSVKKQCEPLGIDVRTFPREGAAVCKREIVKSLSGGRVCIGNGFNDIEMFDVSDLSVAVINAEGMCAKLIAHADVFAMSIKDALELFLKPDRLRATLRS